jgi:hypothetical protein
MPGSLLFPEHGAWLIFARSSFRSIEVDGLVPINRVASIYGRPFRQEPAMEKDDGRR